MKYKFEDSFLELGFIKELLKEFNLPNIPVAVDGMKLYEGQLYIKDLNICRYENGHLRNLTSYYYNRPVLNLTRNMYITTSFYSSDIHEYLGEYLRFIRDYKKINLMGLYNCFSNRAILCKQPKIRDNIFGYENWDNNYNYYAIPVKFGQTYTIGLDSTTPVELYCILWNSVLIEADDENTNFKNLLKNLYSNTKITLNSCLINKPVTYINLKDFDATGLLGFKDNLKLIIKLPNSNKTSITVLEGDYYYNDEVGGAITTTMNIGDETWLDINDNESGYYNINYPTILSLFKVNDEQKHPFADRLIEYLLDTAVTNLDELDDNIKRVQEYLKYLRNAVPKILYGEWDRNMNKEIYNISKKSMISRYNDPEPIPYIAQKTMTITKTDSDGTVKVLEPTQKQLIDIKNDLLMYMDKDVESLFWATGTNDKYIR